MSEHKVRVDWKRESAAFTYATYNRDHDWVFDSGINVRASAHPNYLGNPECVDPEEAFVASLTSCHMLSFFAVAAKRKLVVDRYHDAAVGFLEKGEDGRWGVTRVILHPQIEFGGERRPDADELAELHELAHHACFIANSVKTAITVEP